MKTIPYIIQFDLNNDKEKISSDIYDSINIDDNDDDKKYEKICNFYTRDINEFDEEIYHEILGIIDLLPSSGLLKQDFLQDDYINKFSDIDEYYETTLEYFNEYMYQIPYKNEHFYKFTYFYNKRWYKYKPDYKKIWIKMLKYIKNDFNEDSE